MDDFSSASLDTLYNMKAKWRVSMGAMIMRASKASIISPETAQRLHIKRSRSGWKRHEPLDHLIEHEFPRVLAAGGYKTTPAMAAGEANRVWTLADIAGLLDGNLPSN